MSTLLEIPNNTSHYQHHFNFSTHWVTLDSHTDAVEWARYMECGHALQNECCSDLVTAAQPGLQPAE